MWNSPKWAASVKAGETVAVVESVKTASDIYAPASGTITAVNDALSNAPRTGQQRPLRRRLAVQAGRDRGKHRADGRRSVRGRQQLRAV